MRKPIKSSRKDYFLSGIIKYFIIKILNSLDPLKGPLAEKGYLKSKIKNVPSFNSDNEIISTKEIVEYVFQNTKVLNHIKKYIFQPRLDLVRIIQSPLVKENDQTLWHHDSCGHRIKLYIGLDSYLKKDIYTELVPCTNRNSYFDYNFTRIILTSEEKKIPTKKILLKKGDIFLFDTNMIHRGNYSNNVSRKLIEVEFSSAIRGFILPGKIGRKKNKRENNLLDLVEIKYCF